MYPRQENPLLDINVSCNVNDEKMLLVDNLVESFGIIVSLKSPHTMDHSDRVKKLKMGLALRIGFQADKLKSLEYAAILHDIGKIIISEYVIDKPTRLAEAEYITMKQHTLLGHTIIQHLDLDPLIGNVILYHHESYMMGVAIWRD